MLTEITLHTVSLKRFLRALNKLPLCTFEYRKTLRKQRREMKATLTKVGKVSGYHRSTICGWELQSNENPSSVGHKSWVMALGMISQEYRGMRE